MRVALSALVAVSLALPGAAATVIINEVFINPPGSSLDDTREYIELLGTPGKKLDGYAIALLSGTQARFYTLGSIPPRPAAQEIDEFFSLDGLQLGPNGLLVIGIGATAFYPLRVPDTNFQQWDVLWNGYRDTVGKLNNDGSNTILLLRNRPGPTQATHPLPPAAPDLIWGKDRNIDDELLTPVIDPQDGLPYDQYGDGNIDRGQPNNIDGGNTFDAKGALTLADLSDDLEVVDEVSYEHDRGWEYDLDGRVVDLGSPMVGLPERNVHALDDPQGINPDILVRVDYRTKGPGWPPAAGATGALPNGNNWQDTATEQWIRGESVIGTGGQGAAPQMFLDNAANANVDAIQPYNTQTPLWLSDGVGVEYNFAALNTYQIMAGRLNPLATPYIPGDSDRDGDADIDDILKLRAVFGDDDWIFSNSFSEAPEGDGGDPAAQTRPWDVDATGDNGIEASDLQWTLNFQGSANGRVVGRTYDSFTPETSGVYLNPSLPVVCEVTVSANVPSGRPLTGLHVGDTFDITVSGRVAGGANLLPGQENGIMQFVNDVTLAAGGIVRATAVTPLGLYSTTRESLQTPAGVSGDLGVRTINGFSVNFSQGLSGPVALYRVSFEAIGAGATTAALSAATMPKFAAGTPGGLKVGHTDNNGNPGAVAYPIIAIGVIDAPAFERGDANCDGSVDFFDIDPFLEALFDPIGYAAVYCGGSTDTVDVDCSGGVDFFDIDPFLACLFSSCPPCP